MINLKKALTLNKVFFNTIGKIVLKKHRANIFDKGLNAAGKKFAQYTTAYKKRKMAGKAAPKGKAQISKSGKPNLTLTGDMRKAFTYLKADNNGFEYGIKNDDMSDRMRFQGPEKKKKIKVRFVSTKQNPTTPDMQNFIVKQMQSQIIKNFQKEIKKNGMGFKVYTI